MASDGGQGPRRRRRTGHPGNEPYVLRSLFEDVPLATDDSSDVYITCVEYWGKLSQSYDTRPKSSRLTQVMIFRTKPLHWNISSRDITLRQPPRRLGRFKRPNVYTSITITHPISNRTGGRTQRCSTNRHTCFSKQGLHPLQWHRYFLHAPGA